MRLPVSLLTAAFLLSACGQAANLTAVGKVTSSASRALDAASLGGLADTLAAHPSVELGTPDAYALGDAAGTFLPALSRVVGPLRQALATDLLADPIVSQGLAAWGADSPAEQLTVLKEVATVEAQVMGFQAPEVIAQSAASSQSGMMAYFQASASGGLGQVVLYPDVIAKGGKYLALATLVHEMRHAAQYQLVLANRNPLSGLTSDQKILATAYNQAWQAMDGLGGESSLAYGDYAHLNVEFDAFQTGNEVASLVSKGQYDATGIGFVDTHYGTAGAPSLNLISIGQTLLGSALVTAVNQAEYQAERSGGRQQLPTMRHGGRAPRPF